MRGFTLIEMLLAVVVFSILASVAYPSYQAYTDRARRTDGMSAMSGLQLAQERFRANCPFYAQNLGDANVCGANAGASTVAFGNTSTEGLYTLSIVANSATGNAYTISADPQGVQAQDTDCDPMTLTFNAGNPTGLQGPDGCWD